MGLIRTITLTVSSFFEPDILLSVIIELTVKNKSKFKFVVKFIPKL